LLVMWIGEQRYSSMVAADHLGTCRCRFLAF
jgi:hypothetical protein